LKIMHWLEDAPSFDLFGSIMNLGPQQKEYARTLATGFAIVRSPSGHPVHIKIPGSDDQAGREKIPESAKSDEMTKDFMIQQRECLNIADMEIIPWDVSLSAKNVDDLSPHILVSSTQPQKEKNSNLWDVSQENLGLIMMSPMKTCLYCQCWQTKKQCRFANSTQTLIGQNQKITISIEKWLDKACDEHNKQKRVGDRSMSEIQKLIVDVAQQLQAFNVSQGFGSTYCFIAHAVDEWQHKYPLNDPSRRTVGQRFLSRANHLRSTIGSQ
jgi:hypothetical protein